MDEDQQDKDSNKTIGLINSDSYIEEITVFRLQETQADGKLGLKKFLKYTELPRHQKDKLRKSISQRKRKKIRQNIRIRDQKELLEY